MHAPPCKLYYAVCDDADVAESIGRELLVYGRRIPKAEMFARIDAVDADTVRAVADRFIYDQDVAIAAVGDTQVGFGVPHRFAWVWPSTCGVLGVGGVQMHRRCSDRA